MNRSKNAINYYSCPINSNYHKISNEINTLFHFYKDEVTFSIFGFYHLIKTLPFNYHWTSSNLCKTMSTKNTSLSTVTKYLKTLEDFGLYRRLDMYNSKSSKYTRNYVFNFCLSGFIFDGFKYILHQLIKINEKLTNNVIFSIDSSLSTWRKCKNTSEIKKLITKVVTEIVNLLQDELSEEDFINVFANYLLCNKSFCKIHQNITIKNFEQDYSYCNTESVTYIIRSIYNNIKINLNSNTSFTFVKDPLELLSWRKAKENLFSKEKDNNDYIKHDDGNVLVKHEIDENMETDKSHENMNRRSPSAGDPVETLDTVELEQDEEASNMDFNSIRIQKNNNSEKPVDEIKSVFDSTLEKKQTKDKTQKKQSKNKTDSLEKTTVEAVADKKLSDYTDADNILARQTKQKWTLQRALEESQSKEAKKNSRRANALRFFRQYITNPILLKHIDAFVYSRTYSGDSFSAERVERLCKTLNAMKSDGHRAQAIEYAIENEKASFIEPYKLKPEFMSLNQPSNVNASESSIIKKNKLDNLFN